MPSSLSPEKLKRIISKYVIDSLAWEDMGPPFRPCGAANAVGVPLVYATPSGGRPSAGPER